MVCDGCNCCFSFWAIFCPFVPLTAPKIKISKNGKKTRICHHFTHVYQNLWLDDVQFLRYGARQTDRQTDRRMDKQTDKKSDTEVGAPPKNNKNKLYYKQTQFTGWHSVKCKSLDSRCPKKIHTNLQQTCRSVCIVQRCQSKKSLLHINHVCDWPISQKCSHPTLWEPQKTWGAFFFQLSSGGYNWNIDHKWVG